MSVIWHEVFWILHVLRNRCTLMLHLGGVGRCGRRLPPSVIVIRMRRGRSRPSPRPQAGRPAVRCVKPGAGMAPKGPRTTSADREAWMNARTERMKQHGARAHDRHVSRGRHMARGDFDRGAAGAASTEDAETALRRRAVDLQAGVRTRGTWPWPRPGPRPGPGAPGPGLGRARPEPRPGPRPRRPGPERPRVRGSALRPGPRKRGMRASMASRRVACQR